MVNNRTDWTDADLAHAIETSRSWAGVMRALGKHPTSHGSKNAAQRRAERLGLSTSHFTGQRRWGDDQLREAVLVCCSWTAVLRRLGVASTSAGSVAAVKSHATRLGLPTAHFAQQPITPTDLIDLPALADQLRVAAPVLAMSWFHLRGCVTSQPMEPVGYDFIADTPEGLQRVQVKSTTKWDRRYGGYHASIAPRRTHGPDKDVATPYDPDQIDLFFIVDGDGWMYLVQTPVVAGRAVISLNAYQRFRCGRVGERLAGRGDACGE